MFSVRPFEARTLSWWSHERDNIDLEPVYQRKGGIWSTFDKAYLIDSILNGFDIPKLYVADFTYVNTSLNEKNKPYAVIDGRQRFEAIFDFFDNTFPLNSDFQFFEQPDVNLAGLSYRDLKANHPKIASKFENFNLSVMSVITDDEAKISELFVRLNKNRPLTGAEIRNAMSGALPRMIRRIANHTFFRSCISFSTVRGQDKNAAAKLLLIEFRGRLVETKRAHLDRFVEEGKRSETDDIERASDRVLHVLDEMAGIFIQRDVLLRSQGPVTLYYWFVRGIPREMHSSIRPFLVEFEKERQEARSLLGEAMGHVDQELLQYDLLARSVNDVGSLSERHRILVRRFNAFNSKRGLEAQRKAV